ncbi:MAG: radical SAM protein, partial [Cyanobacteria bacterium J06621_11]
MSNFFSAEKRLFTPVLPQEDAIPVIFAFPNEYTVGITSLGFQIVWAMLSQRADINVSRLFTDSQEPLPARPELMGFSLSWE